MKGDVMRILGMGMQSWLLVVCFLVCGQAQAGSDAKVASYDFISTGKKLELKEGDFSIIPPDGWEVFKSHPSLTLLMQVPHNETLKYQRTIQVASFGGNKFIDEVTAREFESIIVSKFSQLTKSIEDYKIREHRVVDMEDGREGILFYTEFQLEGVSMMQAHILLSSSTRHYLMTYTDLADHFEKEEYSQYLNEAWSSMISVELAGGVGSTFLKKIGLGEFKRFQSLIFLGLGMFVMLLVLLGFKSIRKAYSGNRLSDYTGGGGRDDDLDLSDHGMDSQIQNSLVESDHVTGTGQPTSTYESSTGSMGHSQQVKNSGTPSRHKSSPANRGPIPARKTSEGHLKTAEAADEDTGMDTFFGDDDEDDKAI